jgi:DNA repair protein RadC
LKPSRADEELTAKINEAAKYNDSKILDHTIVTSEGYYSFVKAMSIVYKQSSCRH